MRRDFIQVGTLVGLVAIGLAACSGGESAPETAGEQEATQEPAAVDAPMAMIMEPENGAVVTGPDVHVMLMAHGIEIAPIAEGRAGTGHHHLFIDTDPGALEQPIPTGQPNIVHLGGGQTEYSIQGLQPGEHRIIDVMGDLTHVPVSGAAADTVVFTVQ